MSDCLSNLELFGTPKDGISYQYEQCETVISNEIAKRKKRWLLNRVNHIDYDDISQIIKLHIFNKWSKWDQSQPILLWLNKIITNQSINCIRNLYSSKACICSSCPLNLGGGLCREYGNTRSKDCQTYNIWASSKKFDKEQINFPTSLHELEENAQEKLVCQNSINLMYDTDRFHELMIANLTTTQKEVYTYLYIEGKTEAEVSEIMGYIKNPESNRGAGYRTLIKFKSIFIKKAKEILENHDF
jgi:DNA-directed RNA polymerase specialized sigma24 family protein